DVDRTTDTESRKSNMQRANEGFPLVNIHQLLRRIGRRSAPIADTEMIQQPDTGRKIGLAENQEPNRMDRKRPSLVLEFEEQRVLDRGDQPFAVMKRRVPITERRVVPADDRLKPAARAPTCFQPLDIEG